MNFSYYNQESLKSMRVNNHEPEGVSLQEPIQKLKKAKPINDNDWFVVVTQFKNPRYHFKKNEEVSLEGISFYKKAVCIGDLMHTEKGIRIKGYIMQYV